MLMDDSTIKLLKNAIQKYGWLELPAFGNSMFPFIQQGNICRFVPCEPSLLKKGEVVLCYSKAGRIIAHRFIGMKNHHPPLFILKGDTNFGLDEPIFAEQIIGKLVSVEKQCMKLTQEHFWASLWGKVILSFPLISAILRKFLNRKLKF